LRKFSWALAILWALFCLTLVLRGERRLMVLVVAPLIAATFVALMYAAADFLFDRLLRIAFQGWRKPRD
jgi:hypothetical protein